MQIDKKLTAGTKEIETSDYEYRRQIALQIEYK